MWLLHRLWLDVHVGVAKMLAIVVHGTVSPCHANDVDGFVEAGAAFAHWDSESIEVGADGAAADTVVEAATAENIERGSVFCGADGVVERKERNRDPDADAFGASGNTRAKQERRRHDGVGRDEVHFGEPRRVEAKLIGEDGLLDRLGIADGRILVRSARQLEKGAVFHMAVLRRARGHVTGPGATARDRR